MGPAAQGQHILYHNFTNNPVTYPFNCIVCNGCNALLCQGKKALALRLKGRGVTFKGNGCAGVFLLAWTLFVLQFQSDLISCEMFWSSGAAAEPTVPADSGWESITIVPGFSNRDSGYVPYPHQTGPEALPQACEYRKKKHCDIMTFKSLGTVRFLKIFFEKVFYTHQGLISFFKS